MRMIITIAVLLLLSGCTTIIFEKDHQAKELNIKSQWHHNMVFGSVEVSEPVDLGKQCPDGWSYVSTEFSFTNFLAYNYSQVPAAYAYGGGPEAGIIWVGTVLVGWYPQTVELGCNSRKFFSSSDEG